MLRRSGEFMCLFAILTIASGIVAEKSIVCLFPRVFDIIYSMSSMNPISNIMSASSSTRNLIASRCSSPRLNMSMSLPGVPTIMFAPFLSSYICLSIDAPPYTVTTDSPASAASRFATSVTCSASSRVGAITIADDKSFFSIFCIIGMRNAPVFPVPVLALTTVSLPDIITGMALSCTSVGFSNPIFLSADSKVGFRPIFSNSVMFYSTQERYIM